VILFFHTHPVTASLEDLFGVLDEARERFLKAAKLGFNPILDARDPNLPVGLKVTRSPLRFCSFFLIL